MVRRRYVANCVCVSRINALGRVTNDTDGGHGAQINDLLRLQKANARERTIASVFHQDCRRYIGGAR